MQEKKKELDTARKNDFNETKAEKEHFLGISGAAFLIVPALFRLQSYNQDPGASFPGEAMQQTKERISDEAKQSSSLESNSRFVY